MAVLSAVVPLWLFKESGEPFLADPRQALANIVRQYHEMGLKPVVASEMEFYLIDAEPDHAQPPISPYTGKRLDSDAILSIDELDDFGQFFSDVYAECERQNVPADSAVAENGIGQFEINLMHSDDPLKAADDALWASLITKGVTDPARRRYDAAVKRVEALDFTFHGATYFEQPEAFDDLVDRLRHVLATGQEDQTTALPLIVASAEASWAGAPVMIAAPRSAAYSR